MEASTKPRPSCDIFWVENHMFCKRCGMGAATRRIGQSRWVVAAYLPGSPERYRGLPGVFPTRKAARLRGAAAHIIRVR